MSADPAPAEDDPIDVILAAHDGDARAAITGLLHHLDQARATVKLAGRAVSYGFTRGWLPSANLETERE